MAVVTGAGISFAQSLPLQAPAARNETLTQHVELTCFSGHALTMPCMQLILTAAPPVNGEHDVARLQKYRRPLILFYPNIIQRMTRQSFLENTGSSIAGQKEPITRLHSPWGRDCRDKSNYCHKLLQIHT